MFELNCSFKQHRFFLLGGSAPRCCKPDHSVRQVYGWFLHLYQISVAAGLCGYLLLILEVFGVGLLLRPIGVPATLSLLMVWYAAVPLSFSAFQTMAQVLPRHLSPDPTAPLVRPGLLADGYCLDHANQCGIMRLW